jgi:predicted secreted protein
LKIKSLLFIFSLSALLSVAIISSAVAVPVEKWNKTFGDIEFDCGNFVQQTQDGGYILSGETIINYDEADAAAFLMKLNPDGTEEWNKTFGGPGYDCAYSVQQTEDKGYVLAGYLEGSGQPGERDSDAWLIKTDSNGSEKWNRTYGGIKPDNARSIQSIDDGYMLAGSTSSFGKGGSDAWLIKTDSNGSEKWNKTFGEEGEDSALSINKSKDGGYVLAGNTNSFGAGEADAWLIKTDSNGSEKWNKTFGGGNNDYAYSVQELDDGGYVMDGYTESFGAGGADAWLIKTDSNGTELWNRTFGGPYTDNLYSVQKTKDGGFILAGSIQQTSDYNDTQALLIKTNSKGIQEWNMTFGGKDIDFINFAQETREGEYILVGCTYSYGKVSDVWVIKVGFNKNTDAMLEKPVPELENVKDL